MKTIYVSKTRPGCFSTLREAVLSVADDRDEPVRVKLRRESMKKSSLSEKRTWKSAHRRAVASCFAAATAQKAAPGRVRTVRNV